MSGRAGQEAHSLVLAAARGAMAAASEAEKAAAMTAFLSLHTHPPATGNYVTVLCKGVVCVRCPTLQAVFAINDLASSTRARANLSVLSHNKRAPTPYTPYGMSLHTQISTLTGRVGTHHTTTETHTERDTK